MTIEEANDIIKEYEKYKKCNSEIKLTNGETTSHMPVPFIIWLKYKKKIKKFPWEYYEDEVSE